MRLTGFDKTFEFMICSIVSETIPGQNGQIINILSKHM